MDYKKIKKQAKANLKHNYFKNILIVFICSVLLAGGIKLSSKNIFHIDFSKVSFPKSGNIQIFESVKGKSNSEIIDEFVNKIVEENRPTQQNEKKYTKGVLAVVINELTSTRILLFNVMDSINKIFGGKILLAVMIIVANILYFILRIVFAEPLIIGKDRYFLEKRRYLETDIDRIFYVYKKKRVLKIVGILLLKNLYLLLWNLTIIGGMIKHYEYAMVQYVLAENPNLKRKEAFALSKELTDGNKWNLFLMDVSLIGWGVLGLLTFNLTNILFTNAYKETIYCEIYAEFREKKKAKLSLLKDDLLFIESPVQGIYPEKKKKSFTSYIDFEKDYSLISYILFFFTFSIFGYLYEVILFYFTNGVFVNRGTFYGPWLPIYGFGGIAIIALLKKFRKKPWKMFVASCILCGIIEYGTAWFLETFRNQRYWDYTGHFMNLQGRICLEGLIVFGLGGMRFYLYCCTTSR